MRATGLLPVLAGLAVGLSVVGAAPAAWAADILVSAGGLVRDSYSGAECDAGTDCAIDSQFVITLRGQISFLDAGTRSDGTRFRAYAIDDIDGRFRNEGVVTSTIDEGDGPMDHIELYNNNVPFAGGQAQITNYLGAQGYTEFSLGTLVRLRTAAGTIVDFGDPGGSFSAPVTGTVRAASGNVAVSFSDITLRFMPFATPSGVPEPGSWALMIAGVGLIGGALRRRPVPVMRHRLV